jgi:hypothetical protein
MDRGVPPCALLVRPRARRLPPTIRRGRACVDAPRRAPPLPARRGAARLSMGPRAQEAAWARELLARGRACGTSGDPCARARARFCAHLRLVVAHEQLHFLPPGAVQPAPRACSPLRGRPLPPPPRSIRACARGVRQVPKSDGRRPRPYSGRGNPYSPTAHPGVNRGECRRVVGGSAPAWWQAGTGAQQRDRVREGEPIAHPRIELVAECEMRSAA